jgi:hypothetical protein
MVARKQTRGDAEAGREGSTAFDSYRKQLTVRVLRLALPRAATRNPISPRNRVSSQGGDEKPDFSKKSSFFPGRRRETRFLQEIGFLPRAVMRNPISPRNRVSSQAAAELGRVSCHPSNLHRTAA